MTEHYAVMGHPVAHSKSPQIHAQFAQQLGIDLEYTAIDVAKGKFAQAVTEFKKSGGRGLNITVPYKLEAWELVDQLSGRAKLAGAVNTIKFQNDNSLLGDNTDGIGLVRDLTENLGTAIKGKNILVLGAGGAARGILGPLLEQGPTSLHIANRTVSKAQDLARLFRNQANVSAGGLDDLNQQFDLVINATAASLQGQLPPLPGHLFSRHALAYDLMYAREPTPFLVWAKDHGAATLADGRGMLVEQAAESFFVWRGVRPETHQIIKGLLQS